MKTNKVAIILPSNLPVPAIHGGAIESTIQLVIDQNEVFQDLQITVISTFDKEAKKKSEVYLNTDFIWIKRGIFYNLINIFIRFLRKFFAKNINNLDCYILKKHFKYNEFDRVVIHGNTNYLMAISSLVDKDKLILYVHANLFQNTSERNIMIGKTAGKFLTVSQFIKEEIVKNVQVSHDLIYVIKNPIDLQSFSSFINPIDKETIRMKYNITGEDIVILFIGRIVEDKGIRHLLHAIQLLPETTKYKLLVIGTFGSNFGSGNLNNNFTKEIKKIASKLDDKVIFTGFVHNSKIPAYHGIAHIITMPSICEESAGKVAMEGMASGLPVITTDAGGIPEYVSKECGILIERDDNLIQNIKKALELLISDEELRKKMGNSGKIKASEFSPDIYYFNYVNMVFSSGQT